MSKRKKYKHGCYYESVFPNFYMLIIVVLIVLQWFRVSTNSGETHNGILPEANLVNNGGLFIITLFFLAACVCNQFPSSSKAYRPRC